MPNESLSKFQNAVTRTTAAIGVKTSVFVGSAKLKTHISTLNKEITSLAHDLGSIVYELWEKGEFASEQIEQQCQTIKDKYANIDALNAEIEKLECQEAEVLGTKKQRQDDLTSEKATVYICSDCNTNYDVLPKFCRKCGAKME